MGTLTGGRDAENRRQERKALDVQGEKKNVHLRKSGAVNFRLGVRLCLEQSRRIQWSRQQEEVLVRSFALLVIASGNWALTLVTAAHKRE